MSLGGSDWDRSASFDQPLPWFSCLWRMDAILDLHTGYGTMESYRTALCSHCLICKIGIITGPHRVVVVNELISIKLLEICLPLLGAQGMLGHPSPSSGYGRLVCSPLAQVCRLLCDGELGKCGLVSLVCFLWGS